jgi:hypothetical protein
VFSHSVHTQTAASIQAPFFVIDTYLLFYSQGTQNQVGVES